MPKAAIVYFSGQGHTHLMADALAEGFGKAGVDVFRHRVDGADIKEGRWSDPGGVVDGIKSADAVIFGTPTYMGGVAAQLKAVIDAMGGLWFEQALAGKLAGGFTHSSSPCGEKTATMQYLMVHAAQHGMLWVSNNFLSDRYTGQSNDINFWGSFVGVFGQADIDMSENPTIELHSHEVNNLHAYAKRFAERLGA